MIEPATTIIVKFMKMNGCALPLSVKLPDYINKTELMGCNLNPVVVLTDFRKFGSSSTSPPKKARKKVQTRSIPPDPQLESDSTKSFKIKNELSISLNSHRTASKEIKAMKRKRESWDPSVEYEIEKIIGYHRDKRKKMWYFVKWKNWSNDYNTFEPIDNLTGCHYELMKYFETDRPTSEELKRMNNKLRKAVTERDIYKKLMEGKWNSEDLAEFSRECQDASQMFEMTMPGLQTLQNRIEKEYRYIVRCLIGMYSHQDPGLILRGQNYKLILLLIQLRQKQLEKLASIGKSISSWEKMEITIENNVDLEDFPEIHYLMDMKPGKGVELPKEPLLGCECPEGCTSKSRCCGPLGDSIFAYTESGKLRTSERIAIYECNSRCRCPQSCPNRVVQRGRQVKLCIFKTKSCGWGVKALEKIPKGTFVCEYIGELIPDSEAVVRDVTYFADHRSGYLFDLDFFTDPKLDMYCIDATEHGNVGRFINHSCDPNLVVYPVWIDGLEPNKHRLAFFARRNIRKNEEIQFDYENLEELPLQNVESGKTGGLRMLSNVRCQCNAANCREWIFGNK